jgi:hypothetical protein
MLVFVAFGCAQYDESDTVLGVFSTRYLAQACIDDKREDYDYVAIEEFELDKVGPDLTLEALKLLRVN